MIKLHMIHVLDVTGSMGSFIHFAKRELVNVSNRFQKQFADKVKLHHSLIVYRDHPPEDHTFVYKILVDGGSSKQLKEALQRCSAAGGGDYPEAGLDALYAIKEICTTKASATFRRVFVWGDAPFHGTPYRERSTKCPCGLTQQDIIRLKEELNLQIFGMNLSGERETTASFASFSDSVFDVRHNYMDGISTMLDVIGTVVDAYDWAYNELLPVINETPDLPTVDLAKQLGAPIKRVREGIEVLNYLQLTPEVLVESCAV